MDVSTEELNNALRILNKVRSEAGLMLHEVQGMDYALGIVNKALESRQCRFNCRTARYHYLKGYEDALEYAGSLPHRWGPGEWESRWMAHKEREEGN